MPHGMCFSWRPDILALHIVSDTLIAASYFCIPILLLTFVRRRPELRRFGSLFATFIVSCGLTHLMDVWTIWHPDYWVAGSLKAITAVASIATASALLPLMPFARALRSVTDLEHIHRALESQYRLIVESSTDGFLLIDSKSRATFANARLAQMLGYSVESIRGKSMASLLFDEYIELRAAALSFTDPYAEIQDKELCFRAATGGRVWTKVRAKSMFDPDGNFVGKLIVIADQTQHHQAQQTIAASEREYRNLAEAMPHVVFTADAAGTLGYYNRAWSDYTGLSETRTRKGGWLRALHPDDRRPTLRRWSEAMAAQTAIENEFRLKRAADGAYRWFVSRMLPIRSDDGTVSWIGSCADIHDFKMAVETRDVLDTIGHIIAIRTSDELHYVSPAWFQYTSDRNFPSAQDWNERVHPDDLTTLGRLTGTGTEQGNRVEQVEVRLRAADGVFRAFLARSVALSVADGHTVRHLQTFTDIEDLKRARAAQGYSEAKYRALTDAMPQLVCIIDIDAGIEYANERFLRFAGDAIDPACGAKLENVVHPDDGGVMAAQSHQLRLGRSFEGEIRIRRGDGAFRWHLLRTAPLTDRPDQTGKWIVTAIDIEARKSAEAALRRSAEELAHRAHYDPLTELANRPYFSDRLEGMMLEAARVDARLAVMYLDVDHFKEVNDTLGHAAGDEVLRVTAARIAATLRANDVAGRFGGDEFVIACFADELDAPVIANRICESIRDPIEILGNRVMVSSSIGITIFPYDAIDAADLIQRADAAMYGAKTGGRNTWHRYTPETHVAKHPTPGFEAEMRDGLASDQFIVHYQPIVTTATRRVIGAEALVRWNHPDRGLLGPNEFISFAENHGLIGDIGNRVLMAACQQLTRLNATGLEDFCLSVNVSAVQFLKPAFVAWIARAIEMYDIEPRQLEIEITESIVMNDAPTVIKTLDALDALGVRLSLDDFGTGYSSLAYLKTFPIHTLKIDRSFVADIDTNFTDQAIAKTTITLAHSLGMRVIAEGVETQSQLDVLRALGADCVQGYLISTPLDAGTFEDFMNVVSSEAQPPLPAA